jgi:hypothetical protein
MASINNGKISGIVANVIFYSSHGKDFVRSAPGTNGVKQTKATKNSAAAFGRASALAHPLLNELAAELNFKMLRSNRGKVISAANKWLAGQTSSTTSSLPILPPVELNDQVSLEESLKAPIELTLAGDNTVTVSIGPFNPKTAVKAPRQTYRIELKAVLVTSVKGKGRKEVQQHYPVTTEIAYDNTEVPVQNISFPVQPVAGTTLMIGLAVSFKGKFIPGTDKDRKWLPAAILGFGKIN